MSWKKQPTEGVTLRVLRVLKLVGLNWLIPLFARDM